MKNNKFIGTFNNEKLFGLVKIINNYKYSITFNLADAYNGNIETHPSMLIHYEVLKRDLREI
jgi:hypothetical protein